MIISAIYKWQGAKITYFSQKKRPLQKGGLFSFISLKQAIA
jgi:hypothetical protein